MAMRRVLRMDNEGGPVATPQSRRAALGGVPAVVQEVRDRLRAVQEYESSQREAEQEDLYFADEDQWSDTVRAQREQDLGNAGDGEVFSKPTLTLNITAPAIEVIVNDARAAKLGVKLSSRALRPSKTAFYMQGLLEKIQRESAAVSARMSALRRSVKCGRGFYRLVERYRRDVDPLSPEAFDQELEIRRLRDQGTVYFDWDTNQVDRQDGEWCLHSWMLSLDRRERLWPDVKVVNDGSVLADQAQDSDWYDAAGGTGRFRAVRVAYYYRRITENYTVLYHPQHGYKFDAKKAPNGYGPEHLASPELRKLAKQKGGGVVRRTWSDERLERFVTDGHGVLEQGMYDGRYYPYFGVYGPESFRGGRERFRGLVSLIRDPAQALNMVFSAAIQAVSAPISLLMGDEQADELLDVLNNLWRRPQVVIPYRPQVVEGSNAAAPPPTPVQVMPPVAELVALMQHLRDATMHLAGTPEFTTRANALRERSGAAVETQHELGGRMYAVWLDQLATITMLAEARALVDLIPKKYDRPGRMEWVKNAPDGTEAPFIIKQPFYRDAKGMPHPVPHQKCAGTGLIVVPESGEIYADPECGGTGICPRDQAPETYGDSEVEYVDFAEIADAVEISIAPQEDARQQERLKHLLTLAAAAPEAIIYFLDQIMEDLGQHELAERIRAQVPETSAQKLPFSAEAKQAIAERDRLIEQQGEALKSANEVIRTEQVKQQGRLEEVRLKGQVELSKEQMRVEGRLVELQAKSEAELTREEATELADLHRQRIQNSFEWLKTRMELESKERIADVESGDRQRAAMLKAESDREGVDQKRDQAAAQAAAAAKKPEGE